MGEIITTEAWVIYRGSKDSHKRKNEPAELKLESYSFPGIDENEVLAEPLYGCWEANMTHALERVPIDICTDRGEEKVVIGNAGVVRVIQAGKAVNTIAEGDLCLVFCNGIWDQFGYPKKIFAYDAPNTIGVLSKKTKLHEKQLILIPKKTPYSLQQWAAFSLRYITAWANWQQAYGCWSVQWDGECSATPIIWGWGGGVSLAELALAKLSGYPAAMISSNEERLNIVKKLDIQPIDRRPFINLNYDEERYRNDPGYKKAYLEAEEVFMQIVREYTRGIGVSIFIDYIGTPVLRATIKALAQGGVITTAGWKKGMKTSLLRALECMNWHTHVHTHYAKYSQGVAAVDFAEKTGWMPLLDGKFYDWSDIPQLAHDYSAQKIDTYFPIFQVNPS